MEKRRLGRSGIEIPPLAFGGNVFGWTADEPTSLALLDRFVERGFTLVDTADVYSIWVDGHRGGESETVIGRWLRRGGARDRVVIATKVGMDMKAGGKGLSRDHILRSCEASRQRLGVDRIDLYYAHCDDAEVPLEEALTTFAELVRDGKVGAIGASNFTAPRLAEALAVSARLGLPRFEFLQPNYHLANRDGFEGELRDLCVAEDIGVVPYYALAGGFLTGKYRSDKDLEGRQRARTVAQFLNPRGLTILDALDDIAARCGATQAEVALAWLMAQKGVTAPIASATSLPQLEAIMRAADLRLDGKALAALDAASA